MKGVGLTSESGWLSVHPPTATSVSIIAKFAEILSGLRENNPSSCLGDACPTHLDIACSQITQQLREVWVLLH